MSNILVTGGAGYIGSHVCHILLEKSHNIFVLDNLSNSIIKNIQILKKKHQLKNNQFFFFDKDIRNINDLRSVFEYALRIKKKIDFVIHLSGLKSVSDSLIYPIKYWENNVTGTVNLLKIMDEFNCHNIIFSSSACVYSKNVSPPFTENSLIEPVNPYGHTKATVENILINLFESNPEKWSISILRYFNPIGSDPSLGIGERISNKTKNIFPILCKAALCDDFTFKVYGNNWDTFDGSCIRDYIHVIDVAQAHINTLDVMVSKKLKDKKLVLNIGTGKGTSVLELIKNLEMVIGKKIKYEFSEKREGDLPVTIANNNLAKDVLNWEPEKSLFEMCNDGWKWYCDNSIF